MSMTVQYASTREEVFRWYLGLWKKTIWKVHLLMLFAPMGIVALRLVSSHRPLAADALLESLGFGVVIVAIMWAYPLFMYKPYPRVLTIDAAGITSTIGKRSGVRRWATIASIHETDEGSVVMQLKNGNAFIVPLRAFHSAKAREEFVEVARSWLTMANP